MHRVRGWLMGVAVGGLLTAAQPVVGQVVGQVGERDDASATSYAPASRSIDGHGVRGERFWQVLGDPTLDRLIAEARTGNRELRAAGARVEGAEASRLHAMLELAPIITADAGYTRRRFATSAFPGVGPAVLPDEGVWDTGLRASWELDVFGRIRGGVRARGALADAAVEDVRDSEIAVTAAVARAYFELRGLHEQLSVARRNAENQRRTLDLTEMRLDAGRGTDFDAERARAQLNFTLAAIPSLEAEVAAAEYRIAVIVGRVPHELEPPESGMLPGLPETVPLVRATDVVRERPDVLGAEGRLAASRALVGSARADYLPRLSLMAGAGYTARAFDAFGNTGTFNYAVGPVISWAAFDMGRVRARVDEAQAQEIEARAYYEHVVLRAQEELDAASIRYHRARARLEHLELAAGASERAARLATARYEGGVADFLQVLDAERTLLVAQDQLAQGRTAAAGAYVALYEARGGVWEP
ncbi:MAG TPA: efflux transporter outer membrane subunit [Longimicrobiales bacterium]|nr:efflux transporter outer membrane subunit [Longimicrobiales bacterium]